MIPVYIMYSMNAIFFCSCIEYHKKKMKAIFFLILMYLDTKMCEFFVLFKYNATISQERQADTWVDKPSLRSASQPSIVTDISLSTKRDSLFADRESQLDSLLQPSTMSIYGQDSSLSSLRSSALSRPSAPPIVTTVSNFKHPCHIYVLFNMKTSLEAYQYHCFLFTDCWKNDH